MNSINVGFSGGQNRSCYHRSHFPSLLKSAGSFKPGNGTFLRWDSCEQMEVASDNKGCLSSWKKLQSLRLDQQRQAKTNRGKKLGKWVVINNLFFS